MNGLPDTQRFLRDFEGFRGYACLLCGNVQGQLPTGRLARQGNPRPPLARQIGQHAQRKATADNATSYFRVYLIVITVTNSSSILACI